ncbi:alpha-glucosidase [Enterococcus sp. AZ163]|uniref:alpha-glucosidase n=1 Tax=Enterococcus sp. AZ163 TaxID=2774638 RepID=UPI003D2B2B5C
MEKEKNWWKKEIIYQIYPKSFKDSNHDGIGDLKGIIEKLPYLKELGVTTLWICPIFSSPMVDNGYDIADFEDINRQFGTMEDVDLLLAEAKKFDLKVMLDLVINHTSDEHVWFQKALADKDSPYRDYYIFKEGKEPPNNWRSIFGGSVWEKVPNEECYYLHIFDKRQPDLNWENREMREELYAMINRWLEKGIAGFRIDSITFIKKDQDYGSLPADGVDGLVSCKEKTRNRPGIEIFLHELRRETFDKYNCVTVGEAPGVSYEEFPTYVGEDGYFSMIFDFHYADIDVESGSDWFKRTNWTTVEFKDLLMQSQAALQNAGWGANFIENHDQPRALSKFVAQEFQSANSALGLGAMYFFLRGTPFIYQGQELGMVNAERTSISQFDDISSIDNYARSIKEGFSGKEALRFVNQRSRDNSRTPMPWNDSQYGGFSDQKPWLSMTEEYPKVNAIGNSVFKGYKKMISLRQQSAISDILQVGDIAFIDNLPEAVIGYRRIAKTGSLISYTNFSSEKVVFELEKPINKLHFDSHNKTFSGTKIELLPYQSILISE